MDKFDVNNQVVSVHVVDGSVNSVLIILLVISALFFVVLGAFRYGVGRLRPRRRYKAMVNSLNIALGSFAALSFILGAISLIMGSSDDDKTLDAFNAHVKANTGYDVVFLSAHLNEYFVRETRNNIGKTYHNVVLSRDGRVINCDMRNITTGQNSNTLRYFFTCNGR